MVLGFLRRQWQLPSPGKLPPMMTDEDLARLREKLSPEARKQLENKTPVQQWRVAAAWMRQGFRRAFEERRMHGPLSQNDDERLAEFFEKASAMSSATGCWRCRAKKCSGSCSGCS